MTIHTIVSTQDGIGKMLLQRCFKLDLELANEIEIFRQIDIIHCYRSSSPQTYVHCHLLIKYFMIIVIQRLLFNIFQAFFSVLNLLTKIFI